MLDWQLSGLSAQHLTLGRQLPGWHPSKFLQEFSCSIHCCNLQRHSDEKRVLILDQLLSDQNTCSADKLQGSPCPLKKPCDVKGAQSNHQL